MYASYYTDQTNKNTESGSLIVPPPKSTAWYDDMRQWPAIEEVDIFTYLIERKACDLREMKAYKSTAAYNYFLSQCVGGFLISEQQGGIFLKSQVVLNTYWNTQYILSV